MLFVFVATNHTVKVDGASSSSRVVNGTPGVEYQVRVQALTLNNRPGPISEPVIGKPKPPGQCM